MRTLIVDDEPLARAGLQDYVDQLDFLALVGTAADGLQALDLLNTLSVDLLLLDIEMPQLGGLDLLRSLSKPPLVIVTTAYEQFALEGFKLAVLDYLVKPITFPRFLKACLRAREQYELRQVSPPLASNQERKELDSIFVKAEGRLERIRFTELLYVESMQNYVQLHTERGRFTVLQPLKELREQLPGSQFLQVHRSFIVQLAKVDTVDGHRLLIDNQAIPVSRSYWPIVEKALFK